MPQALERQLDSSSQGSMRSAVTDVVDERPVTSMKNLSG